MRRVVRVAWALLAGAPTSCEKEHGGAPTESAEAAPSPRASADAAPATSAAAGAGEGGAAGVTTVWTGSYKSEAATLYIPPELKVRWRPEETDAGIGDGQLTLSVDASGQVHGALEGPLGPAAVDGYFTDGTLSARIARRDPNDHGFSGVLTAKASGGRLEGTLNVSLATGGALRSATFALAPGDGGTGP